MEPPMHGSLDPKYDHIEMMYTPAVGGVINNYDQIKWFPAEDKIKAFRGGRLIPFLDFIMLYGVTVAEVHVEMVHSCIAGFRINPQMRSTFRQNLRVPNNLIPARELLDEIAVSVTRLHVAHIQNVRNVQRINLYWADPSGCLIALLASTSSYLRGKKENLHVTTRSPILAIKPIEMPTDVKPSSMED